MSATAVLAPIVSAVLKAVLLIGTGMGQLTSMNKDQRLLTTSYFSKHPELALFSDSELRSWASHDDRELNAILEKEKFNIRLKKFLPGEFGVVSILDVLVNWRHIGTKTHIKAENGLVYPAVTLDTGVTCCFDVDSSSSNLIKIETNTSDVVWIATNAQPLEGFALLERIKALKDGMSNVELPCPACRVQFPMIDINQEVDIKWLLGMRFGEYSISQALQQTKLRVNEKGAQVRSAVAVAAMKSFTPKKKTLIIDKPFYFWIERPGLSYPLCAAYVSESDWKEPADFGGK